VRRLLLAVALTVIASAALAQSRGGVSEVRTSGTAQVTPSTYFGTLFGQQRVANPYTLGDVINSYGIDTDIWGVDAGSGRVYALPYEAAIRLEADGGQFAEIQTTRHFRYQAGRQQTILQTVALDAPLDSGVVRFGNHCTHDGLFWQRGNRLDVPLEACRRTQSYYLDGGILDDCHAIDAGADYHPENGNIYEIRFAWLGVHQVDWYINGVQVRSENFDGRLPSVYMTTAHLPLRATVRGNSSMKYICSSVTSEGGADPPSPGFSYSRPAIKTVSAAAGILPIVALRLATTFNGAHSHIEAIPKSISCQSSTPANTRIYAVLNPTTLTGASWSALTGTASEVDISATAYTGGTQVCTFGAAEGTHDLDHVFGINQRSLRTRWSNQTVDVLLVAADSLSGNQNIACSIEWSEIR